MTFTLVVMGGMAVFGWTMVLLDWLARRKDRKHGSRAA